MQEINIIGYSGHSYLCIEIAEQMGYAVKNYYDTAIKPINPYNLNYIGSENSIDNNDNQLFISIGDNTIREKVYNKLVTNKNIIFATLIHYNSFVSKTVSIGNNCLISSGVQINPMSKIGNNVIINTNAVVEHECTVKDHSHIAPGCILLGNVKIGKKCFIGANSTIKQGVEIGDNVIIGAGSVVINNINKPGTYVGVPAKLITKEK
jgi:sugar O-acyltransferase (sialic acid O-acetyltransferase NeuD family)